MVLRVPSAIGVGIKSAFPRIDPGEKEEAEDVLLLLMAFCGKRISLHQERHAWSNVVQPTH
jgi:hypothetical protein